MVGTNIPPTVTITNPFDGANFYLNDYIEFKGNASDNIDGELQGESLVWTSNLHTGELGTGSIIKLNTLSIGEHLITLTATNSNGLKGKNFIVITIESRPPTPFITYPNNQDEFDEGDIITFSGYAIDAEDGELSGTSLVWKSNIDGYLGSGVRFSKTLSKGGHIITLAAKDKDGLIGTANISLNINPTEQSQPISLENSYFSIPLGQTGEVKIIGGQPPYRYYKVPPYIATINIVGNIIKIIPKVIGETTFNIVDRYNNKITLNLTVTASLENIQNTNAGQ